MKVNHVVAIVQESLREKVDDRLEWFFTLVDARSPRAWPEIYRHVEGLSIARPSCIVSNWNIYEPINHFCCCSPPYALDTASIGRRTLGLLRYAGMLHRSSSDFFELLGERGRPNDSRERQIQDHVVTWSAFLQNTHDAHDIWHTSEWMIPYRASVNDHLQFSEFIYWAAF